MTTTITNKVILWIEESLASFPHMESESYKERMLRYVERGESDESLVQSAILHALERVTMNEPDWTFVAARIHLSRLYEEAAMNRETGAKEGYGNLHGLLTLLTDKGIYDRMLLECYDRRELEELEKVIIPTRDTQFTYIGLRTLADRYLAKSHEGDVYELPQERFMIIAMTLMSEEPRERRLSLVKEAYWAMSNLYMTVATPTLANAGKSYGQLSSCFIDTVDDSLRSIYDATTDAATLSKGGGGIAVYLGKIRSKGSSIRGFLGNSSGILPWAKLLNQTAVSVDQLGQRKGAIAVYYNIFGKDILSFLDAKLNNGDERQRLHDLFLGLSVPDLFMEKAEAREDWYVFDPHMIKEVMGFELDDYYDEKVGAGSFRERYYDCVQAARAGRFGEKGVGGYDVIPAIDIFKRIMRSQLETGVPYMFYRDAVNRDNPNKHTGMIYCSNLCTEIAQNSSATTVTEEYTEDGKIIITKRPGDYVTCNLSSISLAKAVEEDVLERLIPIQVRMLDNVIDLNRDRIEVKQAVLTNKKYRAIGLGTFGLHHLLAKKGIRWESEEAVQYNDALYEQIAYLTIKASNQLAIEKGAYPVFQGSEWETGTYFEKRSYTSERWLQLKKEVASSGLRNAWLMAVAPNATTSLIANSTASTDPIFKKEYSEEKKDYKIPVTAPDLNAETTWLYKSAYEIDQKWSIKQNAARQRHVDQAISFNFYVKNTIKAKDLLDLHMTAWKAGLKTTYYTRSTSQSELEACESCSS
ncbi:ribonucleotide-diphosphate reductase subunit alpha [Fictibacillus macauensis ZFHKF-1]|uniref:Ribonucleoside-diphosphate reductase n=1 Tax=Fictibacillus macauensis ZFHKF-1 TaxID=1196324 RepID=I8UHB7_9BACL|nr:ribonucleoside-diphosphate reductase subunit alpha [Fictibacillus macauensis]EIT86305.1 ribonucleotide-diphosphate reductase subunit alpha [Fictibacillus macauensis ZFHKF-1]